MASQILQFLKDSIITVGLVLFNYLMIPWLLPSAFHQAIYFSIIVSVTNFTAIILSWIYFSHTRCYDDEGNFITMLSYKIFGASSTHFVVFISRIVGNIVLVLTLTMYPSLLEVELYLLVFYLKVYLVTVCITTSLYIYEMISNIYGVATGLKYTCKDKSYVCGMMKNPDPFFCDFENDKDVKPKKIEGSSPAEEKKSPFLQDVIKLFDKENGDYGASGKEWTFHSRSRRDSCRL